MRLKNISIEIKTKEDGTPVGEITLFDGRKIIYEGEGTRHAMSFPCNDNALRDEWEDSSDEYEELHSAMFGYMMKMIPEENEEDE